MSVVDPPEPLAPSFSFHPVQLSDFCSLRESNDLHQTFLFTHSDYHYTSPNYFYNDEEADGDIENGNEENFGAYNKMAVNKPPEHMNTTNMISDDENEEDNAMDRRMKGRGYLQERVSSRRSVRDSRRVSLLRDDIDNCKK